ncbi:unnamed protein product [Owenia fusiformis]|uniref:Major facilitator superfamily (MFS) profile domain-containing protein n=1 Tax=Owenia fusiformis TaxID=6347 RepID=A0A8S4N2Y5_OWEFU|nr:unnamed protein product [Owenia fusiformis]
MLFCGIVYGWNIFAVALKKKFNGTQTDIENIATSGALGICIGSFPAGIAFDRFGPRVASISALVLTGSGYTLMWMTTQYRGFFASNIWLMCIIYFVTMLGNSFTFIASLSTNSINFKGKHRGSIVGILSAVFGFSPAIFSLIYDSYFIQGHIFDEQNQRVAEFMIFLAICSVSVNLLGVVGLRIVPEETMPISEDTELRPMDITNAKDKENTTTDNLVNKKTEKIGGPSDKTPLIQNDFSNKPELNVCQVVKTLRFHILFWIVIIIGGVGASFKNNITTVVKSAHLEAKTTSFTVIIPTCCSVARFLSGIFPVWIIDKWKKLPKSSILLFSSFFTLVCQTLFIFYNQDFLSLFTNSMVMSAAYGAFFVLMPIVVIELFGSKYFAQNFGLLNIANGIGIFSFQKLFGELYESNSPPGSIDCYGELCTRWSFAISAIMALFATCLNVLLMYAEVRLVGK